MNSLFKLTAVAMLSVMITSVPLPLVKGKPYYGSGKAMITWYAKEDAQEYSIYRGTKQDGTYKLIEKVSGDQPHKFVDSKRKVSSTYYYKVSDGYNSSIPVEVKLPGALKKDGNNPLTLVNKNSWLSSGYKPTGLTSMDKDYTFAQVKSKKNVNTAYGKLYSVAKKKGYTIKVLSAYRTYSLQKELFAYWTKVDGVKQALRTSAKAGRSEHQTGYALDVSCAKVGWDLVEDFGATPEGKWLSKNAHTYGFIVRYGKDTEKITGYAYEPWHLRYVGVKAAGEIYNSKVTLEEYLGY